MEHLEVRQSDHHEISRCCRIIWRISVHPEKALLAIAWSADIPGYRNSI